MKTSAESCPEILTNLFSDTNLTFNFPDKLKVVNVIQFLRKMIYENLKPYRAVSVLPVVFKVFEGLLHKKVSLHVENIYHHIYLVIEKGIVLNKCFCFD